MLAHIAWTYLLHEYYDRRKVKIIGEDGRSLLLSQMLRREDCSSDGIKRNLEAMAAIRNEVEHKVLGQGDLTFLPIFQACCLNFDKTISDLFGAALSLQSELAFSLQFAKMTIEKLTALQKYVIPAHIQALDARLQEGLTEAELTDLEYQFRVVYTLDSASKSRAHIQFVHPDSAEGKEISNILVKYKPADDLYPYKPSVVASWCHAALDENSPATTILRHGGYIQRVRGQDQNDLRIRISITAFITPRTATTPTQRSG